MTVNPGDLHRALAEGPYADAYSRKRDQPTAQDSSVRRYPEPSQRWRGACNKRSRR